jgi:hypothetical protein
MQLGVAMVTQRPRPRRTSDGAASPGIPAHQHEAQAQHRAPARTRLLRYGWPALVAGILIATAVVAGWRLARGEPGAGDPGVRSTAVIGAAGTVDIVQRITFAGPRPSLTVSIPTREAPAGQFNPRIDELGVRADGHAVPGLATPLAKGETHTFTFAEPATSAVLRYSVRGAIAKAKPSAPGRALALLTPLTFEGQRGLASRTEIPRAGVLNLGCIAAGAALTACGSQTEHYWVVQRIADDPVVDVVAQVDLSEASPPR